MRLDRDERQARPRKSPGFSLREMQKPDQSEQDHRTDLSEQKYKVNRREAENGDPSVARTPALAAVNPPERPRADENDQRVKQKPQKLSAGIIEPSVGQNK